MTSKEYAKAHLGWEVEWNTGSNKGKGKVVGYTDIRVIIDNFTHPVNGDIGSIFLVEVDPNLPFYAWIDIKWIKSARPPITKASSTKCGKCGANAFALFTTVECSRGCK